MKATLIKHLQEANKYLDFVGAQLQKDKKLAQAVTFGEVKLDGYTQALEHLELSIKVLNTQQQLIANYSLEEADSTKLSSTIYKSQKFSTTEKITTSKLDSNKDQ